MVGQPNLQRILTKNIINGPVFLNIVPRFGHMYIPMTGSTDCSDVFSLLGLESMGIHFVHMHGQGYG